MQPIYLGYFQTTDQQKRIEIPCQNESCHYYKPNGFCRTTATITLTVKPNTKSLDYQISCSKYQPKEGTN